MSLRVPRCTRCGHANDIFMSSDLCSWCWEEIGEQMSLDLGLEDEPFPEPADRGGDR